MSNPVRPWRSVPPSIIITLLLGLSLQILWGYHKPPPEHRIKILQAPPDLETLRIFSLGEPVVLSKILMLWLQSFDNQNGQFLSYQTLNYSRITAWLSRIMDMDPRSQYPLLVASHIYTNVPDKARQIIMLDFVYDAFFDDPQNRWPWLAHAAIIARHQLHDLPRALKYAKAIANHASTDMPDWAQEMQIFVLEEMGELNRARIIIGGMLSEGHITDADEIRFLSKKLEQLEAETADKP